MKFTMLKTLCVIVVAAVGALGVAGPAAASVESQIKASLQKQLRHRGFPQATIKSLRCVDTGSRSAQCIATIRHPTAKAFIDVKFGSNGSLIWHVTDIG